MAQHDYDIADQSGSSFRTDLNNLLDAVLSTNSGSSQPTTNAEGTLWVDTTTDLLKVRSSGGTFYGIADTTGNITIDSSKRVAIGTADPGDYNADYDNVLIYQASGNAGLTISTGTTGIGGIAFADGTSGNQAYRGALRYNHSDDHLQTYSSGLLRSTWSTNGTFYTTAATNVHYIISASGSGSTYKLIEGSHSGTQGSVTPGTNTFDVYTNGDVKNGTGVYTTISSDERLKQDITELGTQWEDIKNITLKKFRYKSDPNGELQLGVIAQELQQVCPNLVTTRVADERDAAASGGAISEGDDVYGWKMSILPLKAVKALQEAMARIEELEAKVAALEAA